MKRNVTDGAALLARWTNAHGLTSAVQRVAVTDDVAEAIRSAAREHTLVILGATEEGLLPRLARGTPVLDVVNELDVSVLMAEKARVRTLLERILG